MVADQPLTKGQRRYLIGDSGKNGWFDYNVTAKAEYNFTETSKLRFSYLRIESGYHYGYPDTYLLNASGNPTFSYGTVRESTFLSNGGKAQNVFNLGYETQFSDIKVKLLLGCDQLEDNLGTSPPAQLRRLRNSEPPAPYRRLHPLTIMPICSSRYPSCCPS